jgi:hypothetical protein
MANIQKTLESLQPYVIGIRYLDGKPLIDVVFKNDWVVTNDPKIKKVKGNDEVNYFMFYSETNEIGIDELLENVRKIINLNIEHEKKQELLKVKFNELKKLFKENSLEKLKELKFVFNSHDDDFLPMIDNTSINEETPEPITNDTYYEETINEESTNVINEIPYLDEHGNPLQLSEEELEMIEEEKRAEINRKMLKNKKTT